jgi:hypothetical protein
MVTHDAVSADGDPAVLAWIVVGGVAVVTFLTRVDVAVAAKREPADGGDAPAPYAAIT